MASPSAWTAKAHGVTMSLSSGFGGRSNTRRYISEPTTRCPRPGLPSADTSASTTAEDHIRALTGRRPIRPTSPRCRMSRRLNPGRSSTYQTEEAFQTSGASSPSQCLASHGKLVRRKTAYQLERIHLGQVFGLNLHRQEFMTGKFRTKGRPGSVDFGLVAGGGISKRG